MCPASISGTRRWINPPLCTARELRETSAALPSGYITMRSALDPQYMTQTLRSTIVEIDPLLALQEVRPVTDAVSAIEAPRHFNTDLITAFALGALLLAITGIYAVMAFSVSQRTQEIAIRMTLGAHRAGIAKLVLVSGVRLTLLGCGPRCSWLVSPLSTGQLLSVRRQRN